MATHRFSASAQKRHCATAPIPARNKPCYFFRRNLPLISIDFSHLFIGSLVTWIKTKITLCSKSRSISKFFMWMAWGEKGIFTLVDFFISMCFHRWIKACFHRYSIIQNSFAALEIFCTPLFHPSLPPNPWTPDRFTVSKVLSFSGCHTVRIIHYVAFFSLASFTY